MKPFSLPKRDPLPANEEQMSPAALRPAPNDLRSYLQQRSALGSQAPSKEPESNGSAPPKHANGTAAAAPALTSLDEVLDHLQLLAEQDAPRAVLVMASGPEIDASREAIAVARALLPHARLRVLVDLTRGPNAVSDELGLPRTPGFAELAVGTASFDDIVHVDEATPLQVIPPGGLAVWPNSGTGSKRLARIFEALAQAYDVIVLHADRGTALMLRPILAGRLQRIVAVLARGQSKSGDSSLLELAVFGCPVLAYAQGESERRRSILGRAARWA
jgi:succinoglycan biosynthesis transport protein ExoP